MAHACVDENTVLRLEYVANRNAGRYSLSALDATVASAIAGQRVDLRHAKPDNDLGGKESIGESVLLMKILLMRSRNLLDPPLNFSDGSLS